MGVKGTSLLQVGGTYKAGSRPGGNGMVGGVGVLKEPVGVGQEPGQRAKVVGKRGQGAGKVMG